MPELRDSFIYFIKTTKVEELLGLGVYLGVLEVKDAGGVGPVIGVDFDIIGYIYDKSKPILTTEDGEVVYDVLRDENNVPYWHANLLTPFSLDERARQMAAQSPTIAQAISKIPEFFVVDDSALARFPKNPARMFW